MTSSDPVNIPPDQATRDRIRRELDKNFLVEAAAGTGKTTAIVGRMVELISSGACGIDQLAAITFTRKSGAELRERFQGALLSRWRELARSNDPQQAEMQQRLRFACDGWSQAFVGTIHSFCAALLRERPIEFGIDPAFKEMNEDDEQSIREQAWHDNIQELIATHDPLIAKLTELGIDRGKVKSCFERFVPFRDLEEWPSDAPLAIDLDVLKSQTRQYVEHMRQLIPSFKPPSERGGDGLMPGYVEIVRKSGQMASRDSAFFALLERFDRSVRVVQKCWHDKPTAIRELKRWTEFRDAFVRPGLDYWCNIRYCHLIEFLRGALRVYEKLKRAHGGLDFQDLLLTASRGLRQQPELRSYFQGRYSHLLVDEFQDTDPVQAEMMLYLTSSNPHESDWTRCAPRAGALFLVGDPKQSIYRFRRGDIATYNHVKKIFSQTGGEVLALVTNFRSRHELVHWNNALYQSKFGSLASDFAPAANDMQSGLVTAVEPNADRAIAGLYRLDLPNQLKIDEVREIEADSIARWIRHQLDHQWEVPRSERENANGRTPVVQPRDFLVIPWRKKNIQYYTQALERYAVPYEVDGGNPLQANQALQSLIQCLATIDDPYDSVHYLWLLREFFGFSDRELYEYKAAQGQFVFTSPLPTTLPTPLAKRIERVTSRLRRYRGWLRTQPYVPAVERIAEDLGLFAFAAACTEGNVRAGGLFKAIEHLRCQNRNFDSATDVIDCLQEVLQADESAGCTALAPNANVVRVINLHKAKGLEAPIVFLADVSAVSSHPISFHVDRRGAQPRGYMGISEDKEGHRQGQRHIATPVDWEQYQAVEKQFLDAEHDRLLYVATTRAAAAMIVSIGKSNCHWASLYPHLSQAEPLQIPSHEAMHGQQTTMHGQQTTGRKTLDEPASQNAVTEPPHVATLAARWQAALQPSYAVVTAKKVGLRGKSRPKWEASGDYGHLWGSAVHELLEIAHKLPHADLRASAVRVMAEYRLASQRMEELLATVDSVIRSEIWQRAQSAPRCFSELPIETASSSGQGEKLLIRGVIDLIFRDEQGWVIVDYKTDDITIDNIPEAVGYYRSQLEQYATHWRETTGEAVTELGLYFTRIDRYVAATEWVR